MKPLRRCSPRAQLAAAALVSCLFLGTGCVSNKYKVTSALEAQPRRLDISLGSAPVKTRLDTVIIYQGPGSWKKAAYWDEFVVTFTNETNEPFTLTAVGLVDYAGTIMEAGTDPWKLEKASQAQRDRYTRAGVSFALNTLGYVAFTYGAAGAGVVIGAAMTNTWGGVVAGGTVGLVAVPVTAIVIYANNQKHKHQIEKEFSRRRLALPLTLAKGESRTGSFFFPMTVSPQSLRLEVNREAKPEVFLLPLPMLAGMHRKETAAPAATPSVRH